MSPRELLDLLPHPREVREGLPPGVYFADLTLGDRVVTVKLLQRLWDFPLNIAL